MKNAILFLLIFLFLAVPVNAAGDSKYQEIKIYKEGVREPAPGIAIFKKNNWHFYTSAHLFPKKYQGKFNVIFENKKMAVVEIRNIGNDSVEIFTEETVAPLLKGVHESEPGKIFEAKTKLVKIAPTLLRILSGRHKGKLVLADWEFLAFLWDKKDNNDNQREGLALVIPKDINIFQTGDSGSAFISGGREIFLLSATGPFSTSHEIIFLTKLKI